VFGNIEVSARDDVAVDVRVRTDNGAGYSDGGRIPDGTVRLGPSGPADLTIDAWVAHGDVFLWNHPPDPTFQPPATVVPVIDIDGSTDTSADFVTLPPIEPEWATSVPAAESIIQLDEFLAATHDGWFVLLDGAAVINPDDEIVTGNWIDDESGIIRITTERGEFQLLPRGLLVRPDGEIIDLQALRAELVTGEG
jgi:hypothetical protein